MRHVIIISFVFCLLFAGCESGQKEVGQEAVREFFAKHRVGSSTDYAVMKNGTDHLMTIHGYDNDLDVCKQLLAPYNRDASLSTFPGSYTCVPLNN